jgi:aerobic carbon-monoxide dehydrogenase medium subunit
MYEFQYEKPKTLAKAADLVKAKKDAKLMAGGMTLIPTLKLRLAKLTHVVDLGDLKELVGIKASKAGVVIGAMTTHNAVAASAAVQKAIPALAHLAEGIGDPAVRNRGTIGGSISNNDPAADYPAGLMGLGATVVTNQRKIPADKFFVGMFETALKRGEIVKAVEFPIPKRAAYMKFPNPASRYAIVGVFVAETADGVRVAVTGAGGSVFRVKEMEAALTKKFAPESVASLSVSTDGLNEDIHASAEYRAHLVTVMAKRAVAAAVGK